MSSFTNVTFDEIKVGQSLTVSRTISRNDVEALTFVSRDIDEAMSSMSRFPIASNPPSP